MGKDVGSWRSSLLKNRQGVVACVSNCITILVNEPAWQGVLAYNEFTAQIVKVKPPPWHKDDCPEGDLTGPWLDEDAVRASSWIAREWEATPHHKLVGSAVDVVARKRVIHPVRDWLCAQETKWDGKARVDTWLIRLAGAADTPYTRAVSSMFMIGAAARVFEPGCKVDHTLVLEGKTGAGKSTLLRDLVGAAWFLETEMDLGNKAFFEALRGKWVIELAELDSLSRGELSRVKAVLTKRTDTYRKSYGKDTHDQPRQCVFTGTTEEDAYLKDEKGNRRFWPIAISRVVFGDVLAERDQLWAEAVIRYKKKEPWHVTDRALIGLFEQEQEHRRQADPWEGVIAEYLHGSRFVLRGVTTADVLEALRIPVRERTRFEEMRVGGILRKLGWERVRMRLAGERAYIYKPVDESKWRVERASGVHPTAPATVTDLTERLRAHKPKSPRTPKTH